MLFTACSEVGTTEQPTTPTEPEYVTVSLGLNVELDYEYEPLTRAEENNDLYGIQVYSTPVPATEEPQWTKFAYGLFDNVDNLTIKLVRGYEYKFVATMVKDGKDRMGSCDTLFIHETGSNSATSTPLSESFIYGQLGMFQLGGPYSNNYLNIDRYYGELEGYIPGDNDSKAIVELKRTSFGVKYIAKGNYAEDGILEILMPNEATPKLNLNLAEGNEVSEIYSFNNVRDVWLDENYTKTIAVTLRIAYSDGTTAPLGTHNITFKRNTITIVNVDLTVSGENGVGFEVTEGGEMPEDSEITIKDGKIVDTEIEVN